MLLNDIHKLTHCTDSLASHHNYSRWHSTPPSLLLLAVVTTDVTNHPHFSLPKSPSRTLTWNNDRHRSPSPYRVSASFHVPECKHIPTNSSPALQTLTNGRVTNRWPERILHSHWSAQLWGPAESSTLHLTRAGKFCFWNTTLTIKVGLPWH